MDEKSMEQNNEPAGSQSTESSTQGQQTDGTEIAEELNRLADAFARAVQAAWNSEQRRQLQTNLNQSLKSLVNNVEEVLTDFSKSEQGQEVREQAEKVVERVRSSKVAADLQQGLTTGLRTVAEEMQEFAQNMEERQKTAKDTGSEPDVQNINVETKDDTQDIPVERQDSPEA